MADNDQKLAYFQEITGIEDVALSHQILEAYDWDLDSAIQAMVDKSTDTFPAYDEPMRSADVPQPSVQANSVDTGPGTSSAAALPSNDPPFAMGIWPPSVPVNMMDGFEDDRSLFERIRDGERVRDETNNGGDGTTSVWRVVTLPFFVLLGSYNLMYGVVGLGLLLAGGLLNRGLGALRLSGVVNQPLPVEAGPHPDAAPIVPAPSGASGASEASSFVRAFEMQYGHQHPEFQAVSFMEALRRAGHEFKFLFVYLHAAQNVNTPVFCETTLQNDAVVDFINENFIAWGADIQKTEGFHMSTSLNASQCPFCAIISGSSTETIAVVRQVEGYRTAGELLTILQNVIEEQSNLLIAGRQEQEARNLNSRLREEQDEAYRIGLQADQERERRERAEEDQAARERLDADKKKLQEEKQAAEVARILAQKEADLAQLRRDKALNLGPEPERGADVTHVAVRLPTGERKERRFYNTTKVKALYDYIESLNVVESDKFLLISNFPRVEYGPDKLDLTLKDAGLHPRTNLFVQVQDS